MNIVGKSLRPQRNALLTHNFFFFLYRETFIEKLKDESPNDRNDRAIRVAVKWYADHLKGQPVRAVLLSDDRANREKASAIGLKAVSGKGKHHLRKKQKTYQAYSS
jgi:hypothetical protein